ncbi:MAG: hypothetical protein CO070_07975 [Gallionellales bacterium CG_4_9_14_0_8_um_filter_55_61]|nr:MAG: hypothetical protein CO070_07975 [Gallionellales bacterium CG_4_9_14_0_8_um_filter_55_61]
MALSIVEWKNSFNPFSRYEDYTDLPRISENYPLSNKKARLITLAFLRALFGLSSFLIGLKPLPCIQQHEPSGDMLAGKPLAGSGRNKPPAL